MQNYFEEERKDKKGYALLLKNAKSNGKDAVLQRNRNRYVQVIDNGKQEIVSKEEFINNLQIDKKIQFYSEQRDLKDIVRIHLAQYIPESGYFYLKDGTKITAKDFFEKKLIEIKDNVQPLVFLENSIMSINETEYIENCERIDNLYNKKQTILQEITQDILIGDDENSIVNESDNIHRTFSKNEIGRETVLNTTIIQRQETEKVKLENMRESNIKDGESIGDS